MRERRHQARARASLRARRRRPAADEADPGRDRACGGADLHARAHGRAEHERGQPRPRDVGAHGRRRARTLRDTGRGRCSATRSCACASSDGFSHARSLAFVISLVLVQGIIVLVGLAACWATTALGRGIVRDRSRSRCPARREGCSPTRSTRRAQPGTSGQYLGLVFGLLGALITGTTMMGQMERALNRLYGIEQDRPTVEKYGRAFVLALTAGLLATAAFAMLALGHGIGEVHRATTRHADVWAVVRWPLALGLLMAADRAALPLGAAPPPARRGRGWRSGRRFGIVLWVLATAALGLVLPRSTLVRQDVRPLAGDRGAAPVGAAVVDRDPVRRVAGRAARSGARRRGRRPRTSRRSKASEPEQDGRPPVRAHVAEAMRARRLVPRPAERGNPATEIDRRHATASRGPRATTPSCSSTARSTSPSSTRSSCEPEPGDRVCLHRPRGRRRRVPRRPGHARSATCSPTRAARRRRARAAVALAPEGAGYHEEENLLFVAVVNEAGGEVLLDHRVRRGGSHHQKIVVVRHAGATRPRRRVRRRHRPRARSSRRPRPPRRPAGRPSSTTSTTASTRRGTTCRSSSRGPAVDDVALHVPRAVGGPGAARHARPAPRVCCTAPRSTRRSPSPLPAEPPRRSRPATLAVQVLRTYPAQSPGVSVRARGRAEHRPRLHQGVRARSAA